MKKAIFTLLTMLFLTFGLLAQNQPGIAIPFSEEATKVTLQKGVIPQINYTEAVNDASFIAGADYLKKAQADVTEDNAGNGNPDTDPDDGGWDWNSTVFTHSAAASPKNIYGATAQGLYYAYLDYNDPTYMTAMLDAANVMIADAGIRSAADLVFLMKFQDLPGVTSDIYKDAAKAKFDARIATYTDATGLAVYIRDARAGQGYENGIIPWDIGTWAVAAQMLEDRYPADTYDYAQAADDIAEVLYQDSYNNNPGYFVPTVNNGWDPTYTNKDFWWYTLGISGLIDAFITADVHTDKITNLITLLLDSQYPNGAISGSYGANTNDEDWQSTAYAVASLARVNQATYQTEINYACYWTTLTQDPASGGWVYGSGNHYPEIGGENTAALYFGAKPSDVYVDDDWAGSNNGDVVGGYIFGYDAFDNIQDAIDAVEGSTVNVANGTYVLSSTINVSKSLTLIGETEAGVIIDASGNGTGYGILVKADNVSLSNLTLLPPIVSGSVGTSGGGGFPIHASYNSVGPAPYNNLALSNITIENSNRTPFDVHGYDGVTLTNLTAKNAAFGNGAQVTGCKNVLVSNLTTLNNAWGGFAIYASKAAYLNRGSDNVTVDFNLNSIDEFIYNEDEFGLVNTNTNILNWTYKINNNYNPGTANFTGYMNKTLGDALMFGAGLNSKFTNMSSVVADPTGTTKYVGPGMSIQTAIDAASAGDVIDLAAGDILSTTQIHFDKSLTLQGKGKGITFVRSNVNTASSGHSNDASAWIRTDPLTTVDISDLTLDATGYDTYTAVRFKSSGSVSNVALNEIKHSASQYLGIAVQVQDGNVDITNCDFTQIGRIGVHYRAGVIPGAVISGTFDSNTYTGKGAGDYLDYALDISGATTVTVSNSTITNNLGVASTDGSTSGGVMATTYFPYGLNLPNSVLVTDCELTNNTTGIVVGYDASDVSSVAAHNNNIYDNTSFGISSLVTTVDATNNWWGDASGPQNPTSNPGGTGNAVNDNVIFDPWIGKAETQTASGAVPLTLNFPTSGVDITFNTLPVGGGTVTVQRYNEAPSGYPAPPAGATHAGLWLDITSSMPNYSFSADVTVDVTGLGFDASTSIMYFNSTTNTWVVVNNGTYAAGSPETYTFTTNHFTPFSFINTPATAFNIYLASDSTATASSVIYPNDAWGSTTYDPNDWNFTTTPIELYIVPEPGSIFGAADIVLQWDNTLFSLVGVDEGGGLFDGIQFQFLYNQLGAVDQVTINASRLDNGNFTTVSGDFICKLQLNVLQPGFGPIDFTAMDFRAFDGVGGFDGVYVVGNSASVKSYLGDVASPGDASTGDGLINGTDLSLWASSYWSGVPGFAGAMTNYKVKYDIGPTADNTVYTLPSQDGKIQFEDLVIFAISYGLSGDNVYPKAAPAPKTPVELIVGEPMYLGSETLVPVSISGTVVDVRAMELAFGGSFGKLLSVEKGALLQNVDAPVMVMDKSTANSANVDLAIFGVDAEGLNAEGELLTLRFDGRADVQLSSANVRNSGNSPMNIEIINSDVNSVPTSFALDQNYPNPFNPSTIISYQLPEQRQVKVAIFNMLGEEVSTLVNEVKEAGYHKVEWNGANLTSGVYFYRIEAGDFVSVKKMMLMK